MGGGGVGGGIWNKTGKVTLQIVVPDVLFFKGSFEICGSK